MTKQEVFVVAMWVVWCTVEALGTPVDVGYVNGCLAEVVFLTCFGYHYKFLGNTKRTASVILLLCDYLTVSDAPLLPAVVQRERTPRMYLQSPFHLSFTM